MNSLSPVISFTKEGVNQTAYNNYQTYLNHYRLKKLSPMSFEEFLQNYTS
ncbi:hypothetical protein [Lutibacter citreus]|nr:hypothetical protein [Lutibacter citreus]